MEIRTEKPPEYGERVLFREIPSILEVKNSLIDEILDILKKRQCLDNSEEVWTKLCLDEVLVNAIKHGNNEEPDKLVRVSLFIGEKQWAVRVKDEGEGFVVEDVPDAEDESYLGEGGRGILLMRNYMDEIWYYDKGTGVQLKKEKKHKFKKILDKILLFLKLK